MCRITGFWDFAKIDYDAVKIARKMNNSLEHGGPDDQGIFINKERNLALGNRRLAIIDLSVSGHQPMLSRDNNLVIAYNGEVYNYESIKQELVAKGRIFKSTSDTEVVLEAYQEWGIKCVEKFRGMFALAIWDKHKQELVLLRDRMGIKPLYYYWRDNLFMFASETKAFLQHPKFSKKINEDGLRSFFTFGYIPHPLAIWENTHKLSPGNYLVISHNKQLKVKRYWDLSQYYLQSLDFKADTEKTDNDLVQELKSILLDSFKLRMVSDVPVGVFLSGGIDSTIVTALLQKELNTPLHTFTVGFEDKEYNEANYAKSIAKYLGTEHTEIFCREANALDIVSKLPSIYDEPFGDSSAIPTYLICQMAREQVKVILSGDGGDEIFGGYDKYWKLARLPIYKHDYKSLSYIADSLLKLRPINKIYKLNKLLKILKTKDIRERFALTATGFFPEEIDKLLKLTETQGFITNSFAKGLDSIKGKFNKFDIVSLWMMFDAFQYLPEDILAKVDRASMSVALETREPLLDHKIVEFVAALPARFKCDRQGGKYLLKEILSQYLSPSYFDRPKQGFSVPMKKWLLNDLREMTETFLSKEKLDQFGVLNSDYVLKLKDDFYKKGKGNFYRIWYLLVFQLWADKWLK